jgi:hypothetical protein
MKAFMGHRDCRSSLEQLAARSEDTITAFEAADLAELTWLYGISSGDSRYSVLSTVFQAIADEYERFDALPTDVVSAVSREIKRALPAILHAADGSKGALHASVLMETVTHRVTEWHQ